MTAKAPSSGLRTLALGLALASVAGATACDRPEGKSPDDLARLRLADLHLIIMQFYRSNEHFPNSEEIRLAAQSMGWVTDDMFIDPWKNRYTYRIPGRSAPFDLCSLGPDGKADTEDDICVLNPGHDSPREFGPLPKPQKP